MNFEKINRWALLLANIGVLLGIVVIIVEVQQNTIATKLSARDSATQGHIDYMSHMLDSEVLAQAVSKLQAGEDLSRIETSQVSIFEEVRWRHYERVYYQYINGVLSVQEWEGYKTGILDSLYGSSIRAVVWENAKSKLSRDFSIYVDDLISLNPKVTTQNNNDE